MKLNRQHSISCGLTNAEAALFEEWATAMGYNVNRAVKVAIRYAATHMKPEKPVAEPTEPLETV